MHVNPGANGRSVPLQLRQRRFSASHFHILQQVVQILVWKVKKGEVRKVQKWVELKHVTLHSLRCIN